MQLPVGQWRVGFQSTPPARGATQSAETPDSINIFQTTPPARGATALGSW